MLHAEAEHILSELELAGLFDDVGPPLPAGSYVSGLMRWRDLDAWCLSSVQLRRVRAQPPLAEKCMKSLRER